MLSFDACDTLVADRQQRLLRSAQSDRLIRSDEPKAKPGRRLAPARRRRGISSGPVTAPAS